MSVRFAGYAAVFDRVDRGGDVVRPGAFSGGGAVRPVPLLWQHRGSPVGVVETLAEDERGLRVIGRIEDLGLAGLVASGAVRGLSFGYRVVAAREGRQGAWVRELTGVDLVEISLVAQPMQALARVHAVEG
ncbi:peptidase U35 [Sphingomonas sp. Leaf357]|uniref:HK97 family phage prohead protease n=1 Tax=Sphingomonas sp. Leaf357 TaxID=1736350 RepID=UPI0006FC6DBF|nr:HK97 family phage prohead protease [Sphingomonas sp. Leaf357]KQS03533.1 peptidase U35 [Sphingomonas sp. Leaf357]